MMSAIIAPILLVGLWMTGQGARIPSGEEMRPRHRNPVELIVESPVVALARVVESHRYAITVVVAEYVVGGGDLPRELDLQASGYQTEMVSFQLEADDLMLLALTPDAQLFDSYSLDSYMNLNGEQNFAEYVQILRALHDDDAENDQKASGDAAELVARFADLGVADQLLALWMVVEDEIALGERGLKELIVKTLRSDKDSVLWLGTVLINRNHLETQFVTELAQGLESENKNVRSASINALATLRNGDRGSFDFKRPPAEQQEAIRSWRAWAVEHQRQSP